MSPWTDILSEAELEAYWARWAALDPRTAREARAWWRGLTADQLDIARRRAWLVPCGEDYQLAASYLALALAKAPVCEVIPHQPGRDRGQADAVQILADGGRRLVTILPGGVTDYARQRGFLVIGPETLRLAPADRMEPPAPPSRDPERRALARAIEFGLQISLDIAQAPDTCDAFEHSLAIRAALRVMALEA